MNLLWVVDGVDYFQCSQCQTILAAGDFLRGAETGSVRPYDDSYWKNELAAARDRCFGSSISRVAEVFYFARRPIKRFLDISSGAGFLLDALAELMPETRSTFWGIEPFPPPAEMQSKHENYKVGFLSSLEGSFDGGVCIEVIEHLTPNILRSMIADLATLSAPGAIYYFNSAQPSFVIERDKGYLDPHRRGHIASYSTAGLAPLFAEQGFTLHPFPGRDWGFLAEFGTVAPLTSETALTRLWTPLRENTDLLKKGRFGHFVLAAGLEGARCYLEAATAEERTRWALNLQSELNSLRAT